MAFSGAWLRSNGPFEKLAPQAVHTADPLHAEVQMADPSAPLYTTPIGTMQSGFGIPTDEWMGGQGVLISVDPQEHDLGIGDRAFPSDPYTGGSGLGGGELTATQYSTPAHAVSYGEDINYNTAPMQEYTERYGTIRSEGFGQQSMPATGYRGTFGNSSPENNPPVPGWPDGFRRGSDLMVIGVDRKFRIGQRYHDRHVVTPNDATPATRQTRGTGASPYLSPFDAAKRAITRAWNTPAQLEAPPDFSQDITVDSPPDNAIEVTPDWAFV